LKSSRGFLSTVHSIKLITKGTVEEKVLAMQKLTWEDVQELLSL
jgi:SNF2 family DNA or RNA helicase